jgi:hypothetical protein
MAGLIGRDKHTPPSRPHWLARTNSIRGHGWIGGRGENTRFHHGRIDVEERNSIRVHGWIGGRGVNTRFHHGRIGWQGAR